jgi:hypothetical protein
LNHELRRDARSASRLVDSGFTCGSACGHVGCCDESPNKHATKHFRHTGHPVMQSMELGFLAGADAVERLGQKRVKATADNADNQLLRQRLGFNRLMRSAALEPPVRLDDRRQDDNRSPRPP